MALGNLGAQPSNTRIKQHRLAQERTELQLRTENFRLRNVTHTALEDFRVSGLVLKVLVVVEEGSSIQSNTTVIEVCLEAHLIRVDGLLLKGWQHDDGRDHTLTTESQVRTTGLEATCVGGIPEGNVVKILLVGNTACHLITVDLEDVGAASAVEVSDLTVDLVSRVTKTADEACGIGQCQGALTVDRH